MTVSASEREAAARILQQCRGKRVRRLTGDYLNDPNRPPMCVALSGDTQIAWANYREKTLDPDTGYRTYHVRRADAITSAQLDAIIPHGAEPVLNKEFRRLIKAEPHVLAVLAKRGRIVLTKVGMHGYVARGPNP